MEEVRNKLTKQEQVLLADFWENKELLRAFQKALLTRQVNLAISTMASAPDWENVVTNRGEVNGHKWTFKFLKANFKEVKKARDKNNNDKSA